MSTQNLLLVLMALLCTGAGMGCIYASWQSRIRLNDTFVAVGWMLIFMALFIWSEVFGWEFGFIYSITVPSLVALVFVFRNAKLRSKQQSDQPWMQLSQPAVQAVLGHLGRFLLVVPFALLASLLISLGIGLGLPLSQVNQYVLAVCLFPVLWGLAASWLLSDKSSIRPIASLSVLSVLGLGIAMLGVS